MNTVLFAVGVVSACFVGLGVGVFFFGRTANREACGSVPHVEPHEDCPSQKAGLCPVLDKSGTVQLAKRGQISYRKPKIN